MIDIINDNFNDLAKDYYELQEEYEQLQQENKQLKEELEKKNKKYWQQQCAYYSSILYSLEEWLKSNAKKIEMYADNYRKRNGRLENIEKTPIVGFAYSGKIGIQDTLDKIQELKEKYK